VPSPWGGLTEPELDAVGDLLHTLRQPSRHSVLTDNFCLVMSGPGPTHGRCKLCYKAKLRAYAARPRVAGRGRPQSIDSVNEERRVVIVPKIVRALEQHALRVAETAAQT